MLQAVINVVRISDLRTRVMFTVGALVLYRIGFFIPLPGVDQEMLVDAATVETVQDDELLPGTTV